MRLPDLEEFAVGRIEMLVTTALESIPHTGCEKCILGLAVLERTFLGLVISGSRQPYRSERSADFAISMKSSTGSAPSVWAISTNSITSTRRSPPSYADTKL